MAVPLRIGVTVLVLGLGLTLAGPAPIPGFSIEIPMAAGQGLPTGAASLPASPLRVEGRVSFDEFPPGSLPIESTIRIVNDGAVPLRVSASASALRGPNGAEIPPVYLSASGPQGGGILSGGVPLATLAPGGAATLKIVLTPPSGDAQYIPAGTYTGKLTLRAEGGA